MGDYRNITNEQDLVADLVEEAIEQRGVPFRYILRDMLNPDDILGESSMSDFKEGYDVTMFIESVEHFNGNGDMFDAFGISKVDSAIFQIGDRSFKMKIGAAANIPRPREGDLVYLAISDSLWEIKKVKLDLKYYQLGKNYSYRLVCKLFSYSHETIDNPESDFNSLSSAATLDDSGLRELLNINPEYLIDESEVNKQEMSSIEVEDPDTFGF